MALRHTLRTDARSALSALEACHQSAVVARNVTGDKFAVFNRYLRWANESADQLSRVLGVADVDRLVLTKRHWVLQGLDPASHGDLFRLVYLELDQQIRELESAINDLRAEVGRWAGFGESTLVVADTNVYLQHKRAFFGIDWRSVAGVSVDEPLTLVVPMVVIDELDTTKRDDLRHYARAALKDLHIAFAGHEQESVAMPGSGDGRLSMRLLSDSPQHVPLPDKDSEILDRSHALAQLSQHLVTVATFDVGMALRAGARRDDGLRVTLLPAEERRDPRDNERSKKEQSGAPRPTRQ